MDRILYTFHLRKGQMKSLTELWLEAAQELGGWCRASTAGDVKTVTRRVENEGLSFLTISLPSFGADLQKGLSNGEIHLDDFKGWKRSPKSPGIPLFLGGFLGLIFDRASGVLLDQPNIDAIFAVRQLTLMYQKILIPCSPARVEKAISGYLECEQEVRRADQNRSSVLTDEFRKASLHMWGGVLQQIDEDVYYGRIIPRHGPGATADRIKANAKFDQIEWTDRLERIFPYGEFSLVNWRHYDALSGVNFLEPGAERPVRVITVPKTLKTPRIIAVEPVCMQYIQQGLMAKFVEYLEGSGNKSFPNPSRGIIGFTDQTPNQDLARIGSRNGTLATLDLSEASDRVSNQLVRVMTSSFPHLQEGLDACRSRKADVPGHGVIRLAKFASMGSAVTFPVEALVFSTIAMMGIAHALNTTVGPKLIEQFKTQVRVYGDDIIVPTQFALSVSRYLELFGFKVNRGKSFWTGKFRESCGKEFYDGVDVSIARVRRTLPTELTHVEEMLSLVSFRNQVYDLGLWNTAKWLDEKIGSLFGDHFPIVEETSSVVGRYSVAFDYESNRLHPHLHVPLVKGYVVRTVAPRSGVSGLGALLKCLLKQGGEPFADSRHLERGGRPETVDIKLRWARPY